MSSTMASKRPRAGSRQPEPPGPILTGKGWNRLRHNGQLVRDEVTAGLPPMLRAIAWQQFRQMPMASCACLLLSLLEPQEDPGLYRRNTRRPAGADLFDDIPSLAERDSAEETYDKLCDRHSDRLAVSPWLRPVLAGRARWLAAHRDTRDSAWGRKMLRIKGGKHTQRRFRERGWHPLASVRKAWGLTGAAPTKDPAPH